MSITEASSRGCSGILALAFLNTTWYHHHLMMMMNKIGALESGNNTMSYFVGKKDDEREREREYWVFSGWDILAWIVMLLLHGVEL